MNYIAVFLSGLLFAVGLGLSGMTMPPKVLGFLDIFGNWDPSLLWVMVGAIPTYFLSQKLILKRSHPLLAIDFKVPRDRAIDKKLVMGATLFGVGWGLAGFCPGPAIVSLASDTYQVYVFVASMALGMAIHIFKR